MLDIGDLATIIHFIEIEIFQLQKKIGGYDIEESNNAEEIIVYTDKLSVKLKNMYEELWYEDSGYPSYQELISDYKNTLRLRN
jgi:hypothetical protein